MCSLEEKYFLPNTNNCHDSCMCIFYQLTSLPLCLYAQAILQTKLYDIDVEKKTLNSICSKALIKYIINGKNADNNVCYCSLFALVFTGNVLQIKRKFDGS